MIGRHPDDRGGENGGRRRGRGVPACASRFAPAQAEGNAVTPASARDCAGRGGLVLPVLMGVAAGLLRCAAAGRGDRLGTRAEPAGGGPGHPSAPETTARRSATATPPPSTETSSPDGPTTTSYSATPTRDSTSAVESTTEAPPPTSAPFRQATPPAASTSDHSPLLIGIAVLVLIGAGVAVVQLTGRARASTAAPAPLSEPTAAPITTTTPGQAATPSLADAVVLIGELGEAMLDSGFDVDSVRAAVAEVAAVNGIPQAEIITLPTAMFASAQANGQLATSAVATLGTPLLLHQVDDLNAVVAAARAGRIGPTEARERVRAIRGSPPLYPPLARVAGNALAAAGLV
jgi:Putative threonine/serine exporter